MAKKKLTFEQIRAILLEEKRKYDEEQEFKETVKRVYSRPKDYNKLTKSVKKAADLAPGGLDLHKDENRYYSKENTEQWLSGTSYMETYQSMKEQDSWD